MNILESLYQQADNAGIAVTNFALPTVLSAAVTVNNRRYIGIDRSRLATSCEEAECLAHEIGHFATDSLYASGEIGRKKYEKRADEWAIRRLVPKERFITACRRGCREVWEFAEELNVTCAFAEKVMTYYLEEAVTRRMH